MLNNYVNVCMNHVHNIYNCIIGFIRVDPPHQVAEETENTTLECTVIRKTDDPFIIEWMSKNGTDPLSCSSLNESVNGTVTLPLMIDNVTSEDYQTYICIGRDNSSNKSFVNASAILSKLNVTKLSSTVVS